MAKSIIKTTPDRPLTLDFPVKVEGYSYLASPYSVKNPISVAQAAQLRERRYKHVCKLAALLMRQGHKIFCPIAHSHPIEVIGMAGVIMDGDFSLEQDFALLKHASELIVFKMDGWEQSSGVAREIAFAEEHSIPIRYIENIKWKRAFKGYTLTKPHYKTRK